MKIGCWIAGALASAALLSGCKTTNPYADFRAGAELAVGKPVANFNARERADYLAALIEFHERKLADQRHESVMQRLDNIERRQRAAAAPVYPKITGSPY